MEQVKEIYTVIKMIANDFGDIRFKPYKVIVPIDTKISLFINKQKGFIEIGTNIYSFELIRLCELFTQVNHHTLDFIQLQDYTIARGDIEVVTIEELITILNMEW